MYTRPLQFSVGTIVFANFFSPIASRPLTGDDISDILVRGAEANELACRQAVAEVTSIVYVTVQATVTDIFTTVTSTAGAAPWVPLIAPGVQSATSTQLSAVVPLTTNTSVLGIQTIESTVQAPVAIPSASSISSPLGNSDGACTTGDPLSDLGFYLTNGGTIEATYYFYAAVTPQQASETIPYKCAEVGVGQTVWVNIDPGLRGRINRGLAYSLTSDHPSRGPASWFEFFHNATTNEIWGDVSLIQGYDGAISFRGSDGYHGFSSSLPMATVSASYPAALTTKALYPSNIPAPTVIGPTTAIGTLAADTQAYAFYSQDYPNGPCGVLQTQAYCSNNLTVKAFNPNFVTTNSQFSITFFDGLL